MKAHCKPFKNNTFFSLHRLAKQSVPVCVQKLPIFKLLWLINQTQYYIAWSVINCSSWAQLNLLIYLSKPQVQRQKLQPLHCAQDPKGSKGEAWMSIVCRGSLSAAYFILTVYATVRFVAILAIAQITLLYLGLSLKTADDSL